VNVRLSKKLKWHIDYGPDDHPDAAGVNVLRLPKPKWSDEAAVARWVCQRVDYDDFASVEFDSRGALELFKAWEREAIAAAKNGNFAPLAALVKGRNEMAQSYREDLRLDPETEALLAARLENPRGGKRGRPKLTIEQRQLWELGNPVHAAARETKAIEKWFRQFYPRERGRHDRAVAIAAKRHNIKPRLIGNFLRSRHRV
jgi:hypothetical protein